MDVDQRIGGLLVANNAGLARERDLRREVEGLRATVEAQGLALADGRAKLAAAEAKADQATRLAAAMLPLRLQAERQRDIARTTLIAAAEKFEFYEQQHIAKGTEDGAAKAEVNRAMAAACRAAAGEEAAPFQQRVDDWMLTCFGPEIAADREERNHRLLEEALELVQANRCTASEAHQLVDYVFARPAGDPRQEAGGVMVTLAALCLASGLDMHEAGEAELLRVWEKMDAIRAKQAAKPKHSPLPEAPRG